MWSAQNPILLDASPLTAELVEQVARQHRPVALASTAREGVLKSRQRLEQALADGAVLYGVNTGFGSLAQKRVSPEQLREIQRNLLLSHAAGVGPPLAQDVTRAMLLLLVASLARGLSGVRLVVVERLLELLNRGITPVVPSVGSVGASGDLAPLAHATLVLIGEGEAVYQGCTRSGRETLQLAGLAPLELEAKEGLALINGTHLMAASGALLVRDFERLFDAALCAAAMSIDACRGTDAFLDERVHEARGQIGQISVARRLRALIDGSQIVPSHLHQDPRVQDPYSLRCAPQVLGAALDAAEYVRSIVTRELGAVTDNPLVFGSDTPSTAQDSGAQARRQVISAGNFHGMPLAIAFDLLTVALTHIAGIAERRVYFILAASDAQNPLNPHLSPQPGLHSGLMIAQYTAAACCNELIGLCTPASVANLPTSAGMEDYNSFGAYAATKAERALERATQVVGIELLCAAEALEYQRPLRSGTGVERAHAVVRSAISKREADRPPGPDITTLARMIHAGNFNT